MPLIPIGTDVRPRHAPVANYLIIALNVLVFLLTDAFGGPRGELIKAHYALDAARPQLYQYITYQFLHGDILHLGGNMLFLWIFGNAVCDRLGSAAYLLFYLAGGVFAGVAFTSTADNPLVGASGAIAAVTTAFLALFPRVQITMLVWMFFIFTFQVPATILIVFKMVLWDNVLAPNLDQSAMSNVAYSAHLGGYAFGFTTAFLLLAIRAVPRNQFDIMSLFSRSARRHGLVIGGYGGPPMARPVRVQELHSRPIEATPTSPADALRERIGERLLERDTEAAVATFLELIALDPHQVLSATQQIEIANALAQSRRYQEAAAAYEAYLAAYPASPDVAEVRLFLGLIAARYLHDDARAIRHLRRAVDGLRLDSQRVLAEQELTAAEHRLGLGG